MKCYKKRTEKNFKEGTTRAEVVQKLEEELFELYKDPNLAIKPPQLEQRGGAYYSDAAVRLISSIYNDKRDIQPVNTINNGAIASIPYDSAVEVSCVITKEGPKTNHQRRSSSCRSRISTANQII
ncbi:hypothetical protein GCM10020331_033340 [Ectobacillus funiculus]